MIIPPPILRWLDEKKKTGSPEAGHSEKDRPGLDFKHQGKYRRTLYYSSLIPYNARPSYEEVPIDTFARIEMISKTK